MSVTDSRQLVQAHPFASLAEFQRFRRSERRWFAPEFLDDAIADIRGNGIYCNIFDEHAEPERVRITGTNYRESVVYRRMSSRIRAVDHVFRLALEEGPPTPVLRIYAPEAVTPYALYLRGKHARFIGSEYAPDQAAKEALFPIPAEDLHSLTFPDGVFDVVVANEVFEHVPFLDRVLSEICRVLRPGGTLISTFPFRSNAEESLVKAELRGDEIVYLTEAEYHGNPVDPQGGSLVFEVPGWDVLSRVRDAGFDSAHMVWVQSLPCGILSPGDGGVMVLSARR